MAQLSEWLEIMVAEIARKQDEAQRAVDGVGERGNELPSTEPSASESPAPELPPEYLSTQI